MREIALSLHNLYFKYPDYPDFSSHILFNSINLEVEKGSLSILIGRPGSGKTTLSRILGGLIPRFTGGELKGEISVNGKNITDYNPYDLIKDIGLVFQNPEEEIFTTRCDTEIAFALESLGMAREEIAEKVDNSLSAVGMQNYKEKNPVYLSGGEKKKLLMASLFAVDPDIWVFDEVFEELDPWIREIVLSYVAGKKKTVIILTSKWLDIYGEFADRLLILESAKLHSFTGDSYNDFTEAIKLYGLVPEKIKKPVSVSGGRNKNADTLLKIQGLRFSYADKDDFTVEIDSFKLVKGEITGLIGRNGSGKSTFAKIICGLLDHNNGIITDKTGTPLSPESLNRFVGYLFQNPDFQIFLPTVEEELKIGLKYLGKSVYEMDDAVSKAIRLFDLPEASAPASLISYGTKRKLQAAIYYLLHRSIIILDEADSGLSISDLVSLVNNLYSEDTALVVITHDLDTITRLADRLIFMEKGKIKKIYYQDEFTNLNEFRSSIW